MKFKNEQNYIIHLKLFKTIGFCKLLNPQTKKYFGLNLLKIIIQIQIGYGGISCLLLLISSYYCKNDINELMSHFMLSLASLFSIIKMYNITNNSDLVWSFLNMSSIDFLKYKNHKRDILKVAQTKATSATLILLLLWGSVVVAWSITPFIIKNVYLTVMFNDGPRNFRYNALNYVFPISEKFHNDNFMLFYVIELLEIISWGYFTFVCDSFVISMCVATSYQLKMIAHSYSSLSLESEVKEKIVKNYELKTFISLHQLIHDQQTIFKKIKDMYKVFKPMTFFQLAAQSMLIVLQAYMIFLNHFNGYSFVSIPIIRLLITVTPNIAHLFLTCLFFGDINEQKSSISFALYSSDWTQMSVKYKKMLLLTMQMNDAEKSKLKISLKRVVNLEMFANVMHTTYSVISVLAKSYTKSSKISDV